MSKLERGVFCSFEGIDCSGKTTVLNHVRELSNHAEFTREPGGYPLAEDIRNMIFQNAATMDPRTETMLFYAARIEHSVKRIQPALSEGRNVYCDRYYDSSLAYQGAMHGEFVTNLHNHLIHTDTAIVHPDLTLMFDIPLEVYLQRKQSRGIVKGEEVNQLEDRDILIYEKILANFRKITAQHPERIVVINANQTPDAVLNEVLGVLRSRNLL